MRNSKKFTEVAGSVLSSGYNVRFRAEGCSMNPTIRDGEAILVAPARPEQVRPGDIALYRWERGVRAHRVIRIDRREASGPVFIFRGDASGDDEVVQARQILGRVVSLERRGRSIRLGGKNPRVWRTIRKCASHVTKLIADGWVSKKLAGFVRPRGALLQ